MAIELGTELPARLQALNVPCARLDPDEVRRAVEEFRRFLDRAAASGVDLEPDEVQLVLAGWLQSRRADNLHQQVRMQRELGALSV